MAETMTVGTVKNVIPKEGIVDLRKRVDLTTTELHPTRRKAGIKISVAPAVAEKFKLNGWAK